MIVHTSVTSPMAFLKLVEFSNFLFKTIITIRRALECHWVIWEVMLRHLLGCVSYRDIFYCYRIHWYMETITMHFHCHRVQHKEHHFTPLQATDPGGTITMVTVSGRSFIRQRALLSRRQTQLSRDNLCSEPSVYQWTVNFQYWTLAHAHTHTTTATYCTYYTVENF